MSTILKRALITGILVSIWMIGGFTLLSLIFTSAPHVILRTLTGVLGLLVLFTGIYYAMRSQKQQTDSYAYSQALKTGVFVSLTVAVMLSLASGLYVSLNPHFADDMAKEAETALRQSGASETVIAQKLVAVRLEFTVGRQMFEALVAQTVMGTIFSLIAAAFLRSKNKS